MKLAYCLFVSVAVFHCAIGDIVDEETELPVYDEEWKKEDEVEDVKFSKSNVLFSSFRNDVTTFIDEIGFDSPNLIICD